MLADLVLSSRNVALISSVSLGLGIAYYLMQFVRHEQRVQRIGGVRAPRIAVNIFGGAMWFFRCAKAQRSHKLLQYVDATISQIGTAGSPDCVEIQVKPQQRYLITRDPEHIKTVLTTKFTSFGKGKRFNDLWRPFLGDSIFTTDGAIWHDSRALIRPMFVKDRVSDLAIFEKWVSTLISKLPSGESDMGGRAAAGSQEIDIMDLFYRMTLDITTDFLLGASTNSLSNPHSAFVEAFNDVQRVQTYLTIMGPFKTLIPVGKYNKGIRTIDKFVMPYIEAALALPQSELEKLGGSSDKSFTFLHSIASHTRDPRVLRDQIVAVLLAGRDSTAATLSWAFYELSNCPDKFRRLREEIIETVGTTEMPTYDDLKGMTYLRHVLNETLRLYPAIPFNLRSALEDTTIAGAPGHPPIAVAQGDVVIYSTINMQRRWDLYPEVAENGEKLADPAVFSPERWESWTPKAWNYIPFNGGPRTCVGQNFALTEMAYAFRILQKYDRLEYSGDWNAQYHESAIVGRPGLGVKVKLWEAEVQ